jgi:hypothetical protein
MFSIHRSKNMACVLLSVYMLCAVQTANAYFWPVFKTVEAVVTAARIWIDYLTVKEKKPGSNSAVWRNRWLMTGAVCTAGVGAAYYVHYRLQLAQAEARALLERASQSERDRLHAEALLLTVNELRRQQTTSSGGVGSSPSSAAKSDGVDAEEQVHTGHANAGPVSDAAASVDEEQAVAQATFLSRQEAAERKLAESLAVPNTPSSQSRGGCGMQTELRQAQNQQPEDRSLASSASAAQAQTVEDPELDHTIALSLQETDLQSQGYYVKQQTVVPIEQGAGSAESAQPQQVVVPGLSVSAEEQELQDVLHRDALVQAQEDAAIREALQCQNGEQSLEVQRSLLAQAHARRHMQQSMQEQSELSRLQAQSMQRVAQESVPSAPPPAYKDAMRQRQGDAAGQQ